MGIELTPELIKQCRDIFSQCEQFESDALLRAVFTTAELRPFRLGLPSASSSRDRIDLCLNFLANKQTSNAHNVLVLFVQQLREGFDDGDARRDQLLQLHAALQNASPVLNVTNPQSKGYIRPSPTQLRNFMVYNFSKEDLAALCFDLTAALQAQGNKTRIDLSIVGGETLPSIALNLIQYVDRRGWYDDLVQQVRDARPNAI